MSFVQLCVSDVVEDLMEGMSLSVDADKTLTSQEPEAQQGARALPDKLQGEREIERRIC